jgi:hypothetical protein
VTTSKHKFREEDNMKAELKETEWNVVDLISVQQDREF